MEFRIRGPLEVEDNGRPVALGGPKQRTLLTLLLLTPNRAVSVDRLADAVWAGEPPAAAANALQYHVSQLRKSLGEGAAIVTQEPGYLRLLPPARPCFSLWGRLAPDGGTANPHRARPPGGGPLGWWGGEPLADLADDL